MSDEPDYRRVIRKSYSRLIEDLDPQPILDQFIQYDFLPATTIRDIQELRTTSEKNRALIDRVPTKGLSGYRNFKKFLRNAHQGHLADYLDKMEKKVQEDPKPKPTPQDNPRNRRTNTSGQRTENIGGKDSMSVFGGNVKIKGDVNIKPRGHLNEGFGNRDSNSTVTQPQFYEVGDGGPVTMNRGGDGAINIFAGDVELTGNVNIGDTPLPPEILRMDRRSIDLYLKALGEGETEVHNIRVMVVGHFNVGKTTLTKRLLGEKVNISDRNSTESIDVHVKRCLVALETGFWKDKSKDLHKDDYTARLANVVQQVYDSLETSDISGLVSFDEGHDDSYSNSEGVGTSMNASQLSPQDRSVMDEIKLLEQSTSEDLSNINNYADLSIWDFAGQYAFYGTHQIFLSPRSVYLLVVDLSKPIDSLVCDDTCSKDTDGENRMKVSEFVEFWLQCIHFYTEKEEMVILVGTHADKLAKEGRADNVNNFFSKLRNHLCNKPYSVCLSKHAICIDNSIDDENLKNLKDAIFKVAKSDKIHWGELKPAKWLILERQLHEMRQKEVKIIERDELKEANRTLTFPLTGEELDLFLRFQHACGLLLYFSEQRLEEYILLDPQWLINALKCFITDDKFISNMKLLSGWNTLKENAILTQQFIDLSWESKDKMLKHKKHLLRLMEKLDIVKPVTYREHDSWIPKGSYFTPFMLKKKAPISRLNTTQNPLGKSTYRLCYTFVSKGDPVASGFVPPAIFHRLIAACMSEWQPSMTEPNNMLKYDIFCDFGEFDLDLSGMNTLTLYLRDNYIQMWVTSYSQNQPENNNCITARKRVECFLHKLSSNCLKMDMKTYIKCPRTDCCSSKGMIELSLFRNFPEYRCSKLEEGSAERNHIMKSAEVLCNWIPVDRSKVEDQREHDDGPVNQTDLQQNRVKIQGGASTESGNDGDSVDAYLCTEKDDDARSKKSQTDQAGNSSVFETSDKRSEDDGRIQMEDVAWIEGQINSNDADILASGSTGNVYLLKDADRWGGKVVVKKIERNKNINPIINEIVAARIRHHAIVPLLAKCKSDKHYFFVFPYMEKGELMTAIADDMKRIKEGDTVQMNATKRVSILYQIACAMLYIHTPVDGVRNKIIHGDITSRNIVIDGNDNPRLLDFGIARELQHEQETVNVQSRDPIGTQGYTTVTSFTKLSTETDCRNFGVLILEMLTGSKPIDGNKELQTETIHPRKSRFAACFENVWKVEEGVYHKLKSMAEKCLEKTINASTITKILYDILLDLNQESKTEALGDEKCSLCMLNIIVANTNLYLQDCSLNSSHVAPPVCVACMRNSYLNPIQCLKCRETISTKIGYSWAAILITGYDKDENYREAIKNDVNKMKKILTSKYPLVTGLSENNVIITTLLGLSEAIHKLEKCTTVIVYYSGHHTTDLGFQVDKHSFFKMEDFKCCLNAIKKEIILIMDCCFSPDLGSPIPEIKLQLNASRSDEEAAFTSKGSIFTQLFVETLQRKSTDSFHKDHSGFISVVSLFEQIKEDMKEKPLGGGSTPTMKLIVTEAWDLLIGYTHKTTGIEFHYEDKANVIFKVDILVTIKELKAELLKQVLNVRYKEQFLENHGETLTTYSDIIAITIRKGPDEVGKHELSSIKEVTRAWNQKFELFFGIRNVQNIHSNAKVGVFLDEIKTQDILQNYLMSKDLGGVIVEKRNETVVKVEWTKKKETMERLYELKPTDKQTQDAAYQWLCSKLEEIDENRKIKEATYVVFTVPSGLWKKDENDFLTIELEGLKLACD